MVPEVFGFADCQFAMKTQLSVTLIMHIYTYRYQIHIFSSILILFLNPSSLSQFILTSYHISALQHEGPLTLYARGLKCTNESYNVYSHLLIICIGKETLNLIPIMCSNASTH